MKITRKIKIGLSLFLMSFIILFTFRSFKANAAPTSGTITYHYSIYAKSTWDAYQAAVNNENFIVGEDLKVSGAWDVDTIIEALEDYEANAPYADWIDDWGIPIPFYVSTDLAKSGGDYSTTGKGTNMKYVASGSSHSGNSAEVYAYLRQLFPSKNLNDATTYPQITQVVPGDEIFVGVTAEYTGGTNFNSAVVLLDLQKYAQGGTVQKHANTPQGWTESNQTATNIGVTLGGTNTGGTAQASPFFLGGYSFTVATGLSGNMKIEFTKSSTYGAYNSFSSGQSGMTAITYKTVPASFKEDNCVLTVSGLSDNVDLTNITVEGQSCLSTATNVTVKGEATKQYKGAEVSDGTANVVVTVADSGKLDPSSIKYGSSIAAATQNPLNSSTSGFDVNMSALSPGQSYIAIFKVISSSTLVEKWYAVELIKAKDSNCDLNNLGVSATGTPDIRWNTPFTSATTSYEVYIPKGTTGLNFTPVVDSNLKTITAAYPATSTAQAVTSGTAYAVNNWTNNSQVKFTVTAQSGATKDYTVTLKEVDLKPTSVTATSGSAFNASDTDADNDSRFTIDNLPFKSNQFTLRAVFPNPSIISKVELFQGNVLSTQTVLNNQGATFNITSPSTKTALTETIRMVVTSTSGNSQTFYIDVNRLAANSNTDLGTVSIVANNGSNTTICNSFTGESLTVTYPSGTELPLAYTNFTVTATPSNALSTVEISINNNKVSTHTFTGANAVTANVSIKVIAEDGTTKTYTGQVKRAGANDDQTFTIIDTTYTYQDAGGSTLNGTYTLPQAPTNNAIKNADNLLPYLAKTATFTIKPNTATTKVFIDGVDYTNRPYSLTFSNTPTQHYRSFQVLIKSEYDEVIRPSTTQTGKTSGGLAFTLEVWCEDPDDTRVLTDVKLLHASSSVEISNATNTSIAGNTYSYTLKESQVGSSFKLNLAWNSATTEAFVSTTNAASIMTASNKYSPDKTWSIGTKVYVYLKSQSGNHTVYIIDTQFADERSTENGIQNVEFFTDATKTNKLSIVFNESQTTYPSTATLAVPYSLEEVVAVVTVKHSKETLAAGNKYISAGVDTSLQATQTIKLSQGLNTLYVQGVAENGQTGTRYTFNIEREAGGTENYMETLNINGVDCADSSKIGTNFDYAYVKTKTTFSFYVPRGTGYVNVNFGVSLKASYTISSEAGTSSSLPYGCSITDGSMITLTINVKSEVETVTKTGNGRTYTIKIYCADVENKLDDLSLYVSDTDFTDILDINDNRFTFNKDQINLGTFTVPFKVKNIFFMPDKPGFNGTVKFGSSILTNLSDGYSLALSTPTTYSVKITVTPELANLAAGDANIKQDKTITYSLSIVRQKGSNNAYLQSLEIFIDNVLQTFTVNFDKTKTGPYMVEYVSTTASVATINAVPEDAKATVTGDNDQPLAVSLSGTTSQIFRVKVTAEDEVTTKEYSIQIWTTKANPSTDKALNKITATSNTNATANILSPRWNATIKQYTVPLGSTEDSAILNFTKNSSDSTLHIEGDLEDITSNDLSYSHTVPVAPGATVVYTVYVTAQDGSKGDEYEITISRAPADTNATLKEFTINGQPVTGFKAGDNGGQYKVFIKDAATVYFDGVPTNETTTISDNPAPSSDRQPLNIGSNIFTVVTTAQDGKTTCKYRVDVVRDAPKVIEDLFAYVGTEQRLLPSPFTPTLYTGYTVKLGFDETSVVMSYVSQYVDSKDNTVSVIAPNGSEITSATNNITINNIAVGTSTYKVRVKAQSGETADYEVQITRDAGSDNNQIIQYEYFATSSDKASEQYTNLSVNGTDLSYKYVTARDLLTFDPKIVVSENAKLIMPDDRTLQAGKANIKKVIVESQTGKQRVYTFTVYPCDNDFDIEDINALVKTTNEHSGDHVHNGEHVLDIDETKFIDYENNQLTITVPYSVDQTFLEVIGGGYNSQTYVNGNKYTNKIVNLSVGTNNFVIYIKSEYGEADSAANNAQSNSVTVTIIRQAKSTDSTLKKLEVTWVDEAGETHTATHTSLPGNSLLAIPNIGDNITIVNITALPNDPTAIVNGTGQQSMDDKNQGVFNFTVKCTAEDGSFTDYPIKIARGPIDIDKDNSLTYIEVSDGEGKNYLGQSNFDTNTTTYGTYHIPFSAQNYTITVVKPGYSPSVVLMDNQTVTSGTRTTTILDSDRGKSKTVTVQVQAQDGTKGTLYTIELMFEAPSSNASLSNLTADGATVPGFNPTDEGGTYTLPTRPYDTQSITIGYEASDPKAQVVGDIGLRPLNVGLNTFTVVVTSESGTAYTYHIHVQRDSEAPYLTNLGATDTKLMDTSYKTTEFKKDVYEYTTIVNYMTLHATINATVDNETHVVACSNSTPIETTGLNRTFNVDLVEGANRFVITVTSLDGKTTEYVFSIKRRNEDSTNTDLIGIEIIQIPSFKTDYTNDVREYPFKEANGTVNNDVTKTLYYSVPNGVRKLNVINVIPEKGPDSDGDGATWEVVNAQGNGMSDGSIDLRVGINTIVIIVTAEDLVSTRAIVVNVERKPMDFTVKTDAYEYECTPQGENVCEIDLVNKRASAIEDYTKYIVFNSEQYAGYDKEIYGDIVGYELELPEVTVVTDISDPNCREVVVRIYDGSEERFVTFKLKSSALNSGFSIPEILQQIMPWILLAIAIIILIIILICVNRDKYGAINKKRKKEPKNQDQNKE